jgi:hypothetical protein
MLSPYYNRIFYNKTVEEQNHYMAHFLSDKCKQCIVTQLLQNPPLCSSTILQLSFQYEHFSMLILVHFSPLSSCSPEPSVILSWLIFLPVSLSPVNFLPVCNRIHLIRTKYYSCLPALTSLLSTLIISVQTVFPVHTYISS